MKTQDTQTDNHRSRRWLETLAASGLRVTMPRRVVVETLSESQHAISPYEIFERGRMRYQRLGLVTVYRTLEKMEQLGLIQRVHQPSGCQMFIPAFEGHQHLLICDVCHKICFFEGDAEPLSALLAQVEAQSGYRVEHHWLQLFGECVDCLQHQAGA